jgi:hypothetical protein
MKYQGNFLNGKYHLSGKITFRNEEFTGQFDRGMKHGVGSYKNLQTGESFLGNYQYGVI